jgi:hypothetical protein
MTAYTVELAEEKKRLPAKGDYSEKVIYDVLFSDGSNAEIFQNVGTPPPEKGQVLEGTIAPGNFPGAGPKFTKDKGDWTPSAPSGGASTGQRPYDPAKDRRITHMANLKVAVSFWQIKAYLKEMDGPLAIQDVINIANILDEDVQAIK